MCLKDCILSCRRSLRNNSSPIRSSLHLFSDRTILATFRILTNFVIPLAMLIVGSAFMERSSCPPERIACLLIVGGIGRIATTTLKNLVLAKPEEDGARSRPFLRILRGTFDLFWICWFFATCIIVYRLYSTVQFTPDTNCTSLEPNKTEECLSNSKYCHFVLYQFAFWLLNGIFMLGGACAFTMLAGHYFPCLLGKKLDESSPTSGSTLSPTSIRPISIPHRPLSNTSHA